jgi:hypothetical protein
LADGLASDVASMNCSDIVIPNEVNAAKAVVEHETRPSSRSALSPID